MAIFNEKIQPVYLNKKAAAMCDKLRRSGVFFLFLVESLKLKLVPPEPMRSIFPLKISSGILPVVYIANLILDEPPFMTSILSRIVLLSNWFNIN